MAAVLTAVDRRRAGRHSAPQLGYISIGVLRPGVPVDVVELSARGALVESSAPVRPGARTELALDCRNGRRHAVRGRVVRCWVSALAPIRYRAAMCFDGPLGTG